MTHYHPERLIVQKQSSSVTFYKQRKEGAYILRA